MNSPSIDGSLDLFTSVQEKLAKAFNLPHKTDRQRDAVLVNLANIVKEVEGVWQNINPGINRLYVKRAEIHGKICNHVKDSLKHGEWTSWAAENYRESIKTLQKWMAIAKSSRALEYSQYGCEKVHQLTLVENLLNEEKSKFEDHFENCDLSNDFEGYKCKDFEFAITAIRNKRTSEEANVPLTNDQVKVLTSSCGLLKKDDEVVVRLVEANEDGADLAKTVENIVKTGCKKKSKSKGKNPYSPGRDDFATATQTLIEIIEKAKGNPVVGKGIDVNRLKFLAKLITEYLGGISTNT